MASKMTSFRASEDTQYMLSRFSEYLGVSKAELIEMSLDWLYVSGALNAIADQKYKGSYTTYPEFKYNASKAGIRGLVRRSNGLGVEPITRL